MKLVIIFTLILIELANSQTSCRKIDGKNERHLSGKMERGYVIKICEFEIETAIDEVSWSRDSFSCGINLISNSNYEYEIHCSCEGNNTVIINKIMTYKLHEEKEKEISTTTIIVLSIAAVAILTVAVLFCWLCYPCKF